MASRTFIPVPALIAALSLFALVTSVYPPAAMAQSEAQSEAKQDEKQPVKKLTGYKDLQWGDSMDVVKQKMASMKGFTHDTKRTTPDSLTYEGGEISGYTVDFVILLFSKSGFCKAVFVLSGVSESRITSEYKNLKELLTGKYGKPKDDYKLFRSPYKEGDGYETQAIRLGKATFAAFWTFPGKKEEDYISLRISERLDLVLGYENGDLMTEFQEAAKRKKSEDL